MVGTYVNHALTDMSLFLGTLESLKNQKKDVTEMRKGSECGIGFENWGDFQEGDQVQCYEEQKTKEIHMIEIEKPLAGACEGTRGSFVRQPYSQR